MKDSDIREIILSDLKRKYRKDSNTVIIEELGLCQGEARVDIAVVNGSIDGFEIKSDKDDLRRLAGQAAIYSRVLDSITLIVGKEHLDHAVDIIPNWWGVIVVEEDQSSQLFLKNRRKGKSNPGTDPLAAVQLLWRAEAFKALQERNLQVGLANKPRSVLWEKLVEQLPAAELMTLVRTLVKSRRNWRSDR